MATGIIEVFAKSGYDVVYVARSDEKVAKVRAARRSPSTAQCRRGSCRRMTRPRSSRGCGDHGT